MNRLAALSSPAALSQTEDLRRWTAWGLAVALAGSAAILAWRRLAGALLEPLEVAPLAAIGLAWCCAAALVRWSCRPMGNNAGRPAEYIGLSALLSVATAAFGLSLSVAGTGGGALAALWTVLLAFETAGWQPAWPGLVLKRRSRGGDNGAAEASAELASKGADAVLLDRGLDRCALSAEHGEQVAQHWVRTALPDGRQTLRGVLRLPLATGQRSASAHVAFCPPFPHTPRIEAQSAEGLAVRIKTGQLAPFGARLDLKLAEPAAEPVVIELRIAVVGDE